jgi:hypothetical protein
MVFFVKVDNLIEGCSKELEELDSSAGTVHAFKKVLLWKNPKQEGK